MWLEGEKWIADPLGKGRTKHPQRRNLPGQEHVTNASLSKVKHRARPSPLDDLQVQRVEHRPDELSLGARDEGPEQVAPLDDVEPFYPGLGLFGAQPIFEECLERRPLLISLVVWDQTDKSACFRMPFSPRQHNLPGQLVVRERTHCECHQRL